MINLLLKRDTRERAQRIRDARLSRIQFGTIDTRETFTVESLTHGEQFPALREAYIRFEERKTKGN